MGNNTGMSIGSRMKQARKALKISQQELAKRASLSQSSISDLEIGRSAGTTSLASLAAALGVNALWLENGRGPMRPEDAPKNYQWKIQPPASPEDERSIVQSQLPDEPADELLRRVAEMVETYRLASPSDRNRIDRMVQNVRRRMSAVDKAEPSAS
jgi:transcriptional regulator with XRE-family HTH domain